MAKVSNKFKTTWDTSQDKQVILSDIIPCTYVATYATHLYWYFMEIKTLSPWSSTYIKLKAYAQKGTATTRTDIGMYVAIQS